MGGGASEPAPTRRPRARRWEALNETGSMRSESYEAVFLASPDGILVVDARGRIHAANPAAEALFGYSQDQLVGQGVELLVPERARPYHAGHREAYGAEPHARPMGIGM